jgi:AbrB family looped-hinge helix DNA binding protein
MVEVISIDDAGRLVIPKSIRDSLGVEGGDKFILAQGDNGRLLLQKLDIEEIVARLTEETKGKDIDAIVQAIRKEINEKVRKRYPDLFA